MPATISIDPLGTPATMLLAAALWRTAPEHNRKVPRQLYRGPGSSIRTNAPVAHPFHSGTLTLRLTGTERAYFHANLVTGLVNGQTLRVYPDSLDLLTYVDMVLDAEEWEERYTRLFPGRDEWFTLQVPVAHDAEEAL